MHAMYTHTRKVYTGCIHTSAHMHMHIYKQTLTIYSTGRPEYLEVTNSRLLYELGVLYFFTQFDNWYGINFYGVN